MSDSDNPPQQPVVATPAAPTAPAASPAGAMNKDEQTMGMLCHLTALAKYLIPFGHIIGPLVIWMLKRQEMPFVESEGKESLNFQISMTIYALLAGISILLLVGILLLPAVLIFDFVFIIIASIEAANGKSYRYPLCIRFIK